jgi:hypothetical protein
MKNPVSDSIQRRTHQFKKSILLNGTYAKGASESILYHPKWFSKRWVPKATSPRSTSGFRNPAQRGFRVARNK